MDGTYDPSFSIKLYTKDMQLGYDMARRFKVNFNYRNLGGRILLNLSYIKIIK